MKISNPYTLEEFLPTVERDGIECYYQLCYKNKAIIKLKKIFPKTYQVKFLSKNISSRDFFVLIAKMENFLDDFFLDTQKIPATKIQMVKKVLRDLDYIPIGDKIYRYNFIDN